MQYGDYAEAVHRFAAGGEEDYYAQKYTVDHVARLAVRHGAATVITFSRDHPFELLPNGVGAQGVLLYPPGERARDSELLRVLDELEPTDLVLVAPIQSVLRWAVRNRVRTLPLFFDSFTSLRTLKRRVKAWLLAQGSTMPVTFAGSPIIISRRRKTWHGLASIPHKILPFDFPAIVSPIGLLA